MITILSAEYLGDYKIHVKFNTLEEADVDLYNVIKKFPAAKPLTNPLNFARFYLDPWPTIAWDCGFDLAPEYVYELALDKSPSWKTTV